MQCTECKIVELESKVWQLTRQIDKCCSIITTTPAHYTTGNTYTTNPILGSLDNFPLTIRTNNVDRFIFNNLFQSISTVSKSFLVNSGNLANSNIQSIGISADPTIPNLQGTGIRNIGIGVETLVNTSVYGNVAVGYQAGRDITGAEGNVCIGYTAGKTITNKGSNVAIGPFVLANGPLIDDFNVSNVCIGQFANGNLRQGHGNTTIGPENAEFPNNYWSNTTVGAYLAAYADGATANVIIGGGSLWSLGAGKYNVAIGHGNEITGTATYNILLGQDNGQYGVYGNYNTMIGRANYNTSFNNSILIGSFLQSTGHNQLNIGNVIYGINLYSTQSISNTPTVDGSVAIGNITPTARLDLPASTLNFATLRLRPGVAPTTPNDGDLYYDGTDIKFFTGGVWKTVTLT